MANYLVKEKSSINADNLKANKIIYSRKVIKLSKVKFIVESLNNTNLLIMHIIKFSSPLFFEIIYKVSQTQFQIKNDGI